MRTYLALAALLVVAGCDNYETEAQYVGSGVEKIFEVDGCTGYRFRDYHLVHFVKCEGANTAAHWRQQSGKTSYPVYVPTVWPEE